MAASRGALEFESCDFASVLHYIFNCRTILKHNSVLHYILTLLHQSIVEYFAPFLFCDCNNVMAVFNLCINSSFI